MEKHTDEEILAKFGEIFEMQPAMDEPNIKVEKNTPDLVKVTLSRMYEAPKLGLAKLMEVAEFFGTRNIADPDNFSNGGCETCDYGSSYGFTLDIKPEPKGK